MDDLTLIAGGRQISRWNSVRLTRGVTRMPSDFSLSMTERYPGELDVIVQAGDPCLVQLGADLVVTGYIDRYVPSISDRHHSIDIQGRGKCADLVDCSAIWPGYQVSAVTALDLCKKLGEPYSITATNLCDDQGPRIPQFNINPGETGYAVIERVCRFAGLLVYEGSDGNIILARIGKKQAASGLEEGVNVQSASLAYSMDQRYSDYDCTVQSMAMLGDVGDQPGVWNASTKDPGVPRFRKLTFMAESGIVGVQASQKRVLWEMAHRYGISNQLKVVTDSWRDSKGNLYEPNMSIHLNLPSLKCVDEDWLITEVTYSIEEDSGTTCELTIMPPAAVLPEWLPLQPVFRDVPANVGK